jgi:hypothetical protein
MIFGTAGAGPIYLMGRRDQLRAIVNELDDVSGKANSSKRIEHHSFHEAAAD